MRMGNRRGDFANAGNHEQRKTMILPESRNANSAEG